MSSMLWSVFIHLASERLIHDIECCDFYFPFHNLFMIFKTLFNVEKNLCSDLGSQDNCKCVAVVSVAPVLSVLLSATCIMKRVHLSLAFFGSPGLARPDTADHG